MQKSDQIAYARGISEIGNAFRYLAFPLAVLAIRNSPRDLALAETLATIGMFFGSLIVPTFIDRVTKLRSLVLSDALALVATTCIGYGIYLGSLKLLLLGYLAIALIDTYHQSAMDAVTADLLVEARKPLLYGFSKLQLLVTGGGIVGGLMASHTVPKIPLYAMLIFDAASFIVSSLWILRVANKTLSAKIRVAKTITENHIAAAIAEWRAGFHLAFSDLEMRKHVLCQTIMGACYGITCSTVAGHLVTTLKISGEQFGFVAPSNKAFYLLGALFSLYLGRKKIGLKQLAYSGATLMTVAYVGMATVHVLPFFLLFYGLHQIGNSLVTPTNRTIVMGSCDSASRGRVAAFRGLMIDLGTLVGNLVGLQLLGINTYFGLYACVGFMILMLGIYSTIRKWAI